MIKVKIFQKYFRKFTSDLDFTKPFVFIGKMLEIKI